jgi:hypothetical protein
VISLPYSKHKRYLSGMDWLLYSLDYQSKRALGIGTAIQIVLELDSLLEAKDLEDALKRAARMFPVLFGTVKRDLNAAPYWDIPKQGEWGIAMDVSRVDSRDNAMALLYEDAHIPWKHAREHVKFHLIHTGETSIVGAVFDHCLFDDSGAGLFLDVVHRCLSGQTVSYSSSFAAPPHLSEWGDKFKAGQKVNRLFRQLKEGDPVLSFDSKVQTKGTRNLFQLHTFSLQETIAIQQDAEQAAGYLMTNPYLLAHTARVMKTFYETERKRVGDMVVPVSIDLRKNEQDEIFFNHLSFMFYRIKSTVEADLKSMISDIKQQMYSQVKQGTLLALVKASLLMRIAPVWLSNVVMQLPFAETPSSFSFAALMKSSYTAAEFGSNPVSNIYHLPRIPLKPGLGIFFTQYKEKLTLVISSLEGVISGEEMMNITSHLVESLRKKS